MPPRTRSSVSPPAPQHDEDDRANETSPLLSSENNEDSANYDTVEQDSSAASPKPDKPKKKFRWASLIAIIVLAAVVITVIVLGFLVPPAVQKYVENAVVLEPTALSIEALTPDGVRARIQANFRMDGSRVTDENARKIGRFATGIMRQLGTEETTLKVFVPHYDNAMLGSVVVPPITLSLVDGHNTAMDFVTNLNPGDSESLRAIVNEWLEGKLDKLKLTGSTNISLKSGFLPLGTHNVVESFVVEANQVPTVPDYEIQYLKIFDVPVNDGKGMAIGANGSVTAYNEYPLGLTVPSLGFDVLVSDCDKSLPLIKVASAHSSEIELKPNANVTGEATGLVERLPDALTRTCPGSKLSPLDEFVKHYLGNETAKVFVKASKQTSDLPGWAGDIIENLVLPIDLPSQSVDDFIRNLTLTDVDFKLPNPFSGPNDPSGKPRVSGTVQVLALLPNGFDVGVSVNSLRSTGNLFYHGKKFGELNLRKWQDAKSDKITDEEHTELLRISSKVTDAPIDITDSDVFADLMQEMFFGGENILLDVHAIVDAKIGTVLGSVTVQQVPASGKIPRDALAISLNEGVALTCPKGLAGDLPRSVQPQVGDVVILNTSSTGIHLKARVNFTNPSPYTAYIPLLNIQVLSAGYRIGEVIIEDMEMHLGRIVDAAVKSTWDPTGFGGNDAQREGRKLLSDYLSGKNSTVTVRLHDGSIPGMPALGHALSKLNMTFDTPHLRLPGDDNDGSEPDGHSSFIREAIFHIFSSSATFNLASPLRHNTVHIERINATAYYNHTEPIGQIAYDQPFDAPPGISKTPHLPVEWDIDGVGYEKVQEFLGGSLRLDTIANVTIRLGNWIEEVCYQGYGIGAKVRL